MLRRRNLFGGKEANNFRAKNSTFEQKQKTDFIFVMTNEFRQILVLDPIFHAKKVGAFRSS